VLDREQKEETMKISDEIREFISKGDLFPNQVDELGCIADRIEAEYVELPVDKDGVPIKPGDIVRSKIWSGERKVLRIESVGNCWTVSLSDAMFGCVNVFAHEVAHERPDSLERIAAEIEEADVDGGADWAERIRKLAKEDER
jgi:hypothetical protein